MKVGLVVPCYVDTFYPEVGIATLELLERLGMESQSVVSTLWWRLLREVSRSRLHLHLLLIHDHL